MISHHFIFVTYPISDLASYYFTLCEKSAKKQCSLSLQ